MNHNFKISPFVRLTLLANGKPTYISVFDIQQIYEDTSRRGQEGVRIHFNNDEYTFVEGPLDDVMYAIDEVMNPEWYKEAEEKYHEACNKECSDWDDLMDESIHRDMEKSLCSVIEHNSDVIEKMEDHQIITVITILLMYHFKVEVGKKDHDYLLTNAGRFYRMIERKVKKWTF